MPPSGRINIEAYATNTPSLIYDPDTLESYKFECEDFKERHDIKMVAKEVLDIIKCL